MKKSGIFTAVAAAVTLTAGAAYAAEAGNEKCTVVKDGKGLIKKNKADCGAGSHSCAGRNEAGDADSWITVPKGECQKINAGDFSGVDDSVKDKIEGAA